MKSEVAIIQSTFKFIKKNKKYLANEQKREEIGFLYAKGGDWIC